MLYAGRVATIPIFRCVAVCHPGTNATCSALLLSFSHRQVGTLHQLMGVFYCIAVASNANVMCKGLSVTSTGVDSVSSTRSANALPAWILSTLEEVVQTHRQSAEPPYPLEQTSCSRRSATATNSKLPI